MEYINDVFISYKRGPMNEKWLEEIFLPFFRDYLDNVLPDKPRIFIDKTGINGGANFSDEIFKNLVLSKSFVSIWSPPYFRKSEWCVKEFLTMKYQQQLYKIDSYATPTTLIWPLLFRKLIDPIPPMVKNIQYLDYSEYNVIGEPFFKSELFLKFQVKLSKDVDLIAEIINNAPELHEDFKTVEGRNKITQEINVYLKDNGEQFDFPKQGLISW